MSIHSFPPYQRCFPLGKNLWNTSLNGASYFYPKGRFLLDLKLKETKEQIKESPDFLNDKTSIPSHA